MSRFQSVQWCVAYRNRKSKNYIFHVIKNPVWGWAADPFLFTYSDENYIFAELWDYRTGKGALGYTTFSKMGEWKVVIKEPYHLSYPYMFYIDEDIYICPESNNSKTVYFYKAICFPDVWEKQEAFIKRQKLCDTTFLAKNGELYGFTCSYHEEPYKLNLFKLCKDGKVEWLKKNPIVTGGEMSRPGGDFFEENEKTIRVAQDCSKYYGEALIFTEIKFEWPEFSEKKIKRISVSDIELDKKLKAIGVHTYNRNNDYEVIDLKLKGVNILNLFFRIVLKIKKLIKLQTII